MQFYFFLSVNFINNFVAVIPAIAAQIVAIHTGNTILVGFFEFIELLIAITVVGIICNDAVFNTINVIIEFVNVSF